MILSEMLDDTQEGQVLISLPSDFQTLGSNVPDVGVLPTLVPLGTDAGVVTIVLPLLEQSSTHLHCLRLVFLQAFLPSHRAFVSEPVPHGGVALLALQRLLHVDGAVSEAGLSAVLLYSHPDMKLVPMEGI